MTTDGSPQDGAETISDSLEAGSDVVSQDQAALTAQQDGSQQPETEATPQFVTKAEFEQNNSRLFGRLGSIQDAIAKGQVDRDTTNRSRVAQEQIEQYPEEMRPMGRQLQEIADRLEKIESSRPATTEPTEAQRQWIRDVFEIDDKSPGIPYDLMTREDADSQRQLVRAVMAIKQASPASTTPAVTPPPAGASTNNAQPPPARESAARAASQTEDEIIDSYTKGNIDTETYHKQLDAVGSTLPRE
jgi:hypothetical protein